MGPYYGWQSWGYHRYHQTISILINIYSNWRAVYSQTYLLHLKMPRGAIDSFFDRFISPSLKLNLRSLILGVFDLPNYPVPKGSQCQLYTTLVLLIVDVKELGGFDRILLLF